MSENQNSSVNEEIIAAFDIMWGLHPSPVMLIKANREIVAVNDVGKQLGIPLGMQCFQLTGQQGVCAGCMANQALKDGVARRAAAWQDKLNMFADTYWVPVRGQKGLFIHFGNNITEYVKEVLCE